MAANALPSHPSKTPPYEYQPLPTPTSIRLIRILPKSNDPSESNIAGTEVINCSLETVDLNDAPTYEALSYTWGSPFSSVPQSPQDEKKAEKYDMTHKFPITINGSVTFIQKNLHEALWRLRHFSYNSSAATKKDQELSYDWRFRLSELEQRVEFNKTPLIKAAEHGIHLWVENLLRKGADIRAQDSFGETALHYAAENSHMECVKLLVRAGSDVTLKDEKNRTPLECCEQKKCKGFEAVARFLKMPVEVGNLPEEPDREIRPSKLWIDAICINQDDIAERSSQVKIMDRIYASAKSSVVWLGVEDDKTAMAKDALQILINYPLCFGVHKPKNFRGSWPIEEVKRIRMGMAISQKLTSLYALVRRSWFSRAWVVQEVLLAKNVKLVCGKYILPWKGFLLHAQVSLPFTITGEVKADFWRGAISNPEGQRFNMGGNHRLSFLFNISTKSSLLSLLLLTDHFRASDPRDKVFALLSLVEKQRNSHSIVADYRKSVKDLFVQLAYDLVSCRGVFSTNDIKSEKMPVRFEPLEGLSFLCWSRRSEENPLGLPSWTPDFSESWVRENERIFSKDFQACTSLPQVIRELPSQGRIGLQGFKFDEIAAIAPRAQEPACPSGSCGIYDVPPCRCFERWENTMTQWMDFAWFWERDYPGGDTGARAMWHTLQADGCRSWAEHLLGRQTISFWFWRGPDQWAKKKVEPEKYRENIARDAIMAKKCKRRNLYKTRLGYLGLGRTEIEPGDEVWLFAGARTPFVVQRLDSDSGENVFRFKGETYVHGIMYGEAVKGRKDDLVELQLA